MTSRIIELIPLYKFCSITFHYRKKRRNGDKTDASHTRPVVISVYKRRFTFFHKKTCF